MAMRGKAKVRYGEPTEQSQAYWPPGSVCEPAEICPCCKKPDVSWSPAELRRGKRGFQSGDPGVEYHCVLAFYELQ